MKPTVAWPSVSLTTFTLMLGLERKSGVRVPEIVQSDHRQLEKRAAEIRKSDDSLTFAQAVVRAQDQNPDLVASYYDNQFGIEPEAVEKTEPELTEIAKADLDIVTIAKSHGEDSREYAVAMAKRFDLLGHEDQAEDWRARAAFI